MEPVAGNVPKPEGEPAGEKCVGSRRLAARRQRKQHDGVLRIMPIAHRLARVARDAEEVVRGWGEHDRPRPVSTVDRLSFGQRSGAPLHHQRTEVVAMSGGGQIELALPFGANLGHQGRHAWQVADRRPRNVAKREFALAARPPTERGGRDDALGRPVDVHDRVARLDVVAEQGVRHAVERGEVDPAGLAREERSELRERRSRRHHS